MAPESVPNEHIEEWVGKAYHELLKHVELAEEVLRNEFKISNFDLPVFIDIGREEILQEIDEEDAVKEDPNVLHSVV